MTIFNQSAVSASLSHRSGVLKVNQNAPVSTPRVIDNPNLKTNSGSFSLVLSRQQQQTINDTLGYDKPPLKHSAQLALYHQVATQEKRDEMMMAMSFHITV